MKVVVDSRLLGDFCLPGIFLVAYSGLLLSFSLAKPETAALLFWVVEETRFLKLSGDMDPLLVGMLLELEPCLMAVDGGLNENSCANDEELARLISISVTRNIILYIFLLHSF